MDWQERIVLDPKIPADRPVIERTRPPGECLMVAAFAAALMLPQIPVSAQAPGSGDPVPSLAEIVELPCFQCDGIAVGDITGNGRIDIVASNGNAGSTFWFERGVTWRDWIKRHIFTIRDSPREIEGNDLADFDGDGRLEAISLDQPNGKIYLHKPRGDPRDVWDTVVIRDDRPYVQASLAVDLDGDGRLELVYTWEGDAEGRGGVHFLKFTGNDVLNPDDWVDHVMVQHESAWWLAPRTADLNGNGRHRDIVFTARNLPARNPGARPGLYWIEQPEQLTEPWTLHPIDDRLPHPLQVDMGDLNGDGSDLDLVVGGFETRVIYWYASGRNWQRYEIPLPPEVNGFSPDGVWNVKTARFCGADRDGILAPVTQRRGGGGLLYFRFVDGAFQPVTLMNIDYDHPMDDRMILHDVTGDGRPEVLAPDSGTHANRLLILRIGCAMEEPAGAH